MEPAQMESSTALNINEAIHVSNLHKSYGSGRAVIPVLHNVNIKVPQGAIYGLLGPSGCGKTTLLRCILGRLNVNNGEVFVLGKKPGTEGHGVPGSLVGYMPQEIALFNEFTIEETLNYFGRLHQMPMWKIKERTIFLLDFLDLPKKTRIINQLSGGQMRRTSFAVALLNEPQILVLDEPTVGVDPLLRERIWDHLTEIAQSSNTTIIITTHYIEEARKADVVGLMRSGHMLAESPPSQLMLTHHSETLEAVFLKLCKKDEDAEGDIGRSPIKIDKTYGGDSGSIHEREALLNYQDSIQFQGVNRIESSENTCCGSCLKCFSSICWSSCKPLWITLALIIKNLTVMRRNILFLLFEFLLPSIQIILFCLCIGREPFNLPMAVVNNETSPELGSLFLSMISKETSAQIS